MDYSLFTFIKDDKSLCILIYVDDLVITKNDLNMMIKFKEYLSECFRIKDLENIRYFLSIEIARGPEGMFLSQKNGLDIISEAGLLGGKPTTTPIEQNHKLLFDESPLYTNQYSFS